MAAVIQLDTRDDDLLISRGSEDVVLRWVDLQDGADRYWDGGTSTDPNDINNWSDTDGGSTPATSVPGTGDHAHFTSNGDLNACTLTSDWAVGEITVLEGYTSTIDIGGYNIATITYLASGGIIAFNGGTFETIGNFTHRYPATIVAGNDAMNGVSITVGGNFYARGISGTLLNLRGTAEWTLTTAGSNKASYVEISYCTATSGDDLLAFGSTDSGNNNDVTFLTSIVSLLDPSMLKPGLTNGTDLNPSLVTSLYTGGVPSDPSEIKAGFLDADGDLNPSLIDADGNLKPSLLKWPP